MQPKNTPRKGNRETRTQKRRVRSGQVRLADNSLSGAGIRRGDVVAVDLQKPPRNGDKCAAITAEGKLVVRFYYRQPSGNVRLEARNRRHRSKLYAPHALIIVGRIA